MIPHWHTPAENPIHQYVPESERPFKTSAMDFMGTQVDKNEERVTRLLALSKPRNSLSLAGTMSLQKREHSPESKMRQRHGFVSAAVVPDCFAEKNRTAVDNKYSYNIQQKKKELIPREWAAPKDPVFRKEMEIEPGMKDFELRPKKHQMENPHNLSVFSDRPKFLVEKEREIHEKMVAD